MLFIVEWLDSEYFSNSLLTADAEILPDYQVHVRCQNAIKQGVILLADFKTGHHGGNGGRNRHPYAVLRSEVLPFVQNRI